MYLTNTRPCICFVVNTLSQYMVNPKHIHLVGEKHVMRYLKETLDYSLKYESRGKIRLHWFTNSYWEGSAEDRKSTSGCCFSLGECSACSKAAWLHKLLAGLFNTEMDAIEIYCDNQSCIKLTENPVFHDKSKHIEKKFHYIWDMVQRGVVKLQYVPT